MFSVKNIVAKQPAAKLRPFHNILPRDPGVQSADEWSDRGAVYHNRRLGI
jgi:hypothetical protein